MKKSMVLLSVVVCILIAGSAIASDSGSLYILPDVFPLPEEGEPVACEHKFGETSTLDTFTIELDEYYHCYMEIAVQAKTCEKCGVTAYDLDYELFPHEGTEMFCERCGKHLVPPTILAPLQ